MPLENASVPVTLRLHKILHSSGISSLEDAQLALKTVAYSIVPNTIFRTAPKEIHMNFWRNMDPSITKCYRYSVQVCQEQVTNIAMQRPRTWTTILQEKSDLLGRALNESLGLSYSPNDQTPGLPYAPDPRKIAQSLVEFEIKYRQGVLDKQPETAEITVAEAPRVANLPVVKQPVVKQSVVKQPATPLPVVKQPALAETSNYSIHKQLIEDSSQGFSISASYSEVQRQQDTPVENPQKEIGFHYGVDPNPVVPPPSTQPGIGATFGLCLGVMFLAIYCNVKLWISSKNELCK